MRKFLGCSRFEIHKVTFSYLYDVADIEYGVKNLLQLLYRLRFKIFFLFEQKFNKIEKKIKNSKSRFP